jgi:Tellurite resistance protein TerB
MILIWGLRARAKTTGTGEFFCAKCGADRSYVLQQIRRWFTLFFIPLFPVGKTLGEQVKCSTCGTCFRPDVLTTPTSASFSENLRGAMRIASMSMLVAGDQDNDAARAAAVDAARRTGTESYDETWLARDLAALDPSHLPDYLSPLARGLDPQGKETFITQVARIGVADGPLSAPEMHVLESLSAALGISAAHLRGIVVSTMPGTQAPSIGDGPPDEYRSN